MASYQVLWSNKPLTTWSTKVLDSYLLVEDYLISKFRLNEEQLDQIDQDGTLEVGDVMIWLEEV